MFQKHTPQPSSDTLPEESSARPARKRAKDTVDASGTNVLLSDVEITGSVRFTNDVVIDGKIDGEIHSEGAVTVGRTAVLKATIHARSVLVEGKVEGDITASERLELNEKSEVVGHVQAAILCMQAGAILIGSSAVGPASAQAKSPLHQGPVTASSSDPAVAATTPQRTLAHA